MNDKREPVFHTIPEKEFVNREKEIDNIYKLALETSNETTQSIYLYGKRNIGKTEVLKRVYNRLFWEQDKVIPFYYCFYKEFTDLFDFAKDYLTEFVNQYLGFIKKRPSLVKKNLSLFKITELLKDEEFSRLKELIDNYREYANNRDCQEVVKNSIFAPYHISVEGCRRVFVILDDFHRTKHITSSEIKPNLLSEFSKVLNNRFSPHLITGYSIKMARDIFNKDTIIGKSDIMTLKGLDKKDVNILFEKMCRLYKVKFLKENISLMTGQLAFNPFYIKSFIRSARSLGVDIYSLKDFQKLYLHEVTLGNICFYLSSMLNNLFNSSEKRLAIKILKACAESPKKSFSAGFLAEVVSSSLENTSRVLLALQEGDLVEIDFGRVKGIQDPLLIDFIHFTYSTMIEGQDSASVTIEMARKGLKAFSQKNRARFSEELKVQLEKILNSFDCQRVPMSLFDFESFFSQQYGKAGSKRLSENQKQEIKSFSLPQIIGVSKAHIDILAPESENIILLGDGFEDGSYEEEKETLWQCGIFFSPSVIRVDEVEAFLKAVHKINKTVGNLKTVSWIVAKDGFTDMAIEMINYYEIKYSNLNQLRHLSDLILQDKENDEPAEESAAVKRENEFELIIPMGDDTELVAVKAVEEIARRANFDKDSIEQIKMALIEACINASEHSKMKDGKIVVKFIVDYDKLIVYVGNEGNGFEPSLVREPNIDQKIRSGSYRGWGIKLMRSLMDEVKFEKGSGGTKLKMVKLMRK